MSLLGRLIDEHNMSQREFQRRTEEIANDRPELQKRGVSQGALSNFVNDRVDTDISTMHLIAMTMASVDTSKSTGEWLSLLILEAGYPLGDVTPDDVRRWTEEMLMARNVEPDAATLSGLRRVQGEIEKLIQRLSDY